MAKWIRIAETNCKDRSREDEFNEWYNNVHLPLLFKSPLGVVTASRYERLNPKKGQGRYLAIYEIETEDMEQALAAHMTYGKGLIDQGLHSDLLELVSVDNFMKIYSLSSGQPAPSL